MKYFGFLLSIPMVVFAAGEDKELSFNEQFTYKIEEKEMFNFDDQMTKMLVSFETDEEDGSFSLFEEDSDASISNMGDEVSGIDESTRRNDLSEVYEDEYDPEFYPSEETIPQRSKIIQTQPKVASPRKNQATVQNQPVVKQKRANQQVTAQKPQQSQKSRKRIQEQAIAQEPQRVQRPAKRPQPQEMATEDSQTLQQQPRKRAPAAKAQPASPVKKKAVPARSPVVQNGQKTTQAPANMRKKGAAANSVSRNNNVAQKKSAVVKKGQVQKRNPNAAVRRPTVEIDQFEE